MIWVKKSCGRYLSVLLSCLLLLSSLSGLSALADEDDHEHVWDGASEYDVQESVSREADDPAQQHRVYSTEWAYPTCSVCGIRGSGKPVSNSEKSSYRDEDHVWNEDGTECTVCGYQLEEDGGDENPCLHERADYCEPWEHWDTDNAVDNGDGTHTVQKGQAHEKRCPDCGEAWDWEIIGEMKTITEDHQWDGDDQGHTCWICGAGNSCLHENAYLEEFVHYETDAAVDISETEHTVYVAQAQQMRCPDCDATWDWELLEELHEETMPHEWNWDEANGSTCWICGRENSCQHERSFPLQWVHDFPETAEPLDDMVHTIWVQIERQQYCPDCDVQWGEVEIVKAEEQTVEHSWDDEEGRFCVCGFENSCTHENAEYEEWLHYETDTAEAIDDATHTLMVAQAHQMQCPDCGAKWGWELLEDLHEETMAHEWNWDEVNGNTCWVCGYENPCEHENAYEFDDWYEVYKVFETSADTHTAEIQYYSGMHCDDCGTTFDIVWADGTTILTGGHEWDENQNYNICWVCGYEKSGNGDDPEDKCEHYPELVLGYFCDPVEGGKVESDENGHAVEVVYYFGRYCMDCDRMYVESELENGVEEGEHSWYEEDGVQKCWWCGYVNENPDAEPCQHEDIDLYQWREDVDGTAEAVDETTHKVYVEIKRQEGCFVCGEQWGEIITVEEQSGWRTEEHVWNDEDGRTCSVCGYENPCQHENAVKELMDDFTVMRVLSQDEDGHSAVVQRWTQMHCPDCDLRFEGWEDGGAEVLEGAHEWDEEDSSVCWICGYEKPAPVPTAIPTAAPVVTPAPTATPTPVPTEEPTATPTVAPTKEPTATPTAIPTGEPSVKPTEAPTEEPTAEPTSVSTEEPTAEPTATPTARPTKKPAATPTPVPMPTVKPLEPIVNYEDVPEDEVVHGIAAAEEKRMAVTLVTAVEQIEQESGEGTVIEIVNADKVLTVEEKSKLDELPVKEQILVLLTAVGHGDERWIMRWRTWA